MKSAEKTELRIPQLDLACPADRRLMFEGPSLYRVQVDWDTLMNSMTSCLHIDDVVSFTSVLIRLSQQIVVLFIYLFLNIHETFLNWTVSSGVNKVLLN